MTFVTPAVVAAIVRLTALLCCRPPPSPSTLKV
jgi:hypothetical protein